MPTSGHGPISLVLEVITRLGPTSVLEVGTGYGKWGVLCREYLGATARIEGIEGWPQYLGPLHAAVYTRVHVGDARTVLPTLSGPFDLVLLIDVFEHFTREDGRKVLAECSRIGRAVLISVPATWKAQTASCGNPFETHQAQYRASDFERLGFQLWRMADHLVALRAPVRLQLRGTFARWAAATLAPHLTGVLVSARDTARAWYRQRRADSAGTVRRPSLAGPLQDRDGKD